MKKNDKLPFFGIGKILPYMKQHKRLLWIMVGCGLAGSLMDIAIPLFQRFALNTFVVGQTLKGIGLFAAIYFVCILLAALLNYISCTLATVVEVRVLKDLRNAAFGHLQTLSFTYFNQHSVGYIHARVMSDTGRIGTLVSWRIMDCIWHGSYLIGSVIVMLVINAKLALMVLAILPLVAVLFSLFQRRLIKVNREIREINSTITGGFNESITGAKTVKTLVVERQMEERFMKDTAAMREKTVRAARLRGLFAATIGLASSSALAIVLWQGGYIAAEEVGTFSMFMSYAQGMMEPVRWLIDVISELVSTQVNIERVTHLLETESDVVDRPEVIEKYGDSFHPKRENWEPIRGDIEFQNVDFKYPDGEEYVLEQFNLKIPFGTNLAIVGETGAGKSTLVNLVCRFFEPTRGKVLIDGRDARDRSQLWLHSAIGYVL